MLFYYALKKNIKKKLKKVIFREKSKGKKNEINRSKNGFVNI